jgi:hypothetical protein
LGGALAEIHAVQAGFEEFFAQWFDELEAELVAGVAGNEQTAGHRPPPMACRPDGPRPAEITETQELRQVLQGLAEERHALEAVRIAAEDQIERLARAAAELAQAREQL